MILAARTLALPAAVIAACMAAGAPARANAPAADHGQDREPAAPAGHTAAITAVAPQPAEPLSVSKKDLALAAKHVSWDRATSLASEAAEAAHDHRQRWQKTLDQRMGKAPGRVLNIYNTWTREFLAVDLTAAARAPEALLASERVNHFFRCHFTNQPADMDPRLFATLLAAADHFRVDRIDIVSGFRSPKYNLVLQKKGREVARNSQHSHGRAVDFRLPGVNARRVLDWARSLRLGGVGYYPSSGFVHIDTGRVRYWTGR